MHQETRTLLQLMQLSHNESASGVNLKEARSTQEIIEELGAPEMAALFTSVEALVAAVDSLALEEPVPHQLEVLRVIVAYGAFLGALKVVDQAIAVPGSRPFSSMRWWPRLLQRWRYHVCSFFSWGLLPENVVEEVSKVLLDLGAVGLVDPLAASGWHARLWQDVGHLTVVAIDSYPIRPVAWTNVRVADARTVPGFGVSGNGVSLHPWALFLSWPPHSPETVGLDLLRRWEGDFVIYLGEHWMEEDEDEGLTGGKALLEAIGSGWEPMQVWPIPQWPGYNDTLTLYRRKLKQS